MKVLTRLLDIAMVLFLVLGLSLIITQAQVNPTNVYSDLKILNRPLAVVNNAPVVGLKEIGGILAPPNDSTTPIITREVQSYGNVSTITNNNKNFNITSGIAKLLKADFETSNYKLKVVGLNNVRLIEAVNFYTLPFSSEGNVVVQALVVDGITANRVNGDETTAKAGLENAIKKLAPTSGSVTLANNTISGAFGTSLIIAVKIVKVEPIGSPTIMNATARFGEDAAFAPVTNSQRYIINAMQYQPAELVSYGLRLEDIYCMKFQVRNSAVDPSNAKLTTYCPSLARLPNTRISTYTQNQFYNRTIDTLSLNYVVGEKKFVRTLLTFEDPTFTLNAGNPSLIENMNVSFVLKEQSYEIKK